MNAEEAILRGNRILIAIERGQMAVSAEDFKKMQATFLKLDKLGARSVISFCGGMVGMLAGVTMLWSGPAVIGLFIITFNGILIAAQLRQKKTARRYVEVVNQEYPKVASDFERAA
jgi:hypothetical protein